MTTNADDATATYRGFRRQALYALFRLFNSLPEGYTIQPEGLEDLAIYDTDGKLIEIVQVKDYSENLTASDFKPSFYKRIARYCAPGSPTTVRIASYGPIGPDLKKASTGDPAAQSRVIKTVAKNPPAKKNQKARSGMPLSSGLTEAEARNIVNHLKLTEVDEANLTDAIVESLSTTITSANPRKAFEDLMWWLFNSSETKLRIDRSIAIAKIELIGKILSQRAAYYDEWHSTIVPIAPSASTNEYIGSPEDEFYRGGRVRFDHVNMDLDVSRDSFLKTIHQGFAHNNVVIIHSASGQGKTTLAYRYAKEFAASDFRFEVLTSSDLNHARRLALALSGHAEAVQVPTLVYVDVKPGDDNWSEIVRILSSSVGIRVLVSIREEDWARANVSKADFPYVEVKLFFEKEEAEAIYNRLKERITHSRHLDFEDAWSQFGDRKTLFEFVYFVTQEETLAGRISSQITALQDSVNRQQRRAEELELLRLVSVASAYEARLDLEKLLQYCQLPAPHRTLELFNDEYLIRVSKDGRHVEGYHSIRSELIVSELTEPVIYPWSRAAAIVLPFIIEEDLHSFLLCTFSRNSDASKYLVEALDRLQPRTWVGVHGIATALLWNGLRSYTEQNAELLQEVFDQASSGWNFVLDWDLAQVCGKDGVKLFDEFERILPGAFAEQAEYARLVKSKQSDKDAVFSDMRHWLESRIESPSHPTDIMNFNAMGEVLFWLGHLQIESPLRGSVSCEVIDEALNELPIYSFGLFARGLQICAREIHDTWFKKRYDKFIIHLREKAGIISLDETDEKMVAHYVIDLEQQSSLLNVDGNFVEGTKSNIHRLSMERVELLNNLFPYKKEYGAIGYGHRISLVPLPYDDANKPGVHKEYLPAKCLTRFNSLAHGLAERTNRPNNWADYFQSLQALREKVLTSFADLRQSIARYKNSTPPAGSEFLQEGLQWDECSQTINKLLLPKVAFDEWGFLTETSLSKSADSRLERYAGLNRFNPVWQAIVEYTRTVGSFMKLVRKCAELVPYLQKSQAQKDLVMAVASMVGVNDDTLRQSIIEGFDACAAIEKLQRVSRIVFGEHGLPGTDSKFCEREQQEFLATITEWCLSIDEDARRLASEKSSKNLQPRRQKPHQNRGPSCLLVRSRHRLVRTLNSLKKKGIKAQILSEKVLWNGMPALWISYDTTHPIVSLCAIETMWSHLIEAFKPDRDKIARLKAMDLLWPTIIVVPLVAGKSLEKMGFTRFKGVSYIEPPDLHEHRWQLFPEPLRDEVCSQLGRDHWEIQSVWALFDEFANAYNLLVHHVDHLADFNRFSGELDELGVSILQSYLNHEAARLEQRAQEVFDSCSAVIQKFSNFDEQKFEEHPNMFLCMQTLVGMKDAILPLPDSNGKFTLSIEVISGWRDRLVKALSGLGIARYLWIADSLNFGLPSDLEKLAP